MASKINNVGVGKPGDMLVKGSYDRVPAKSPMSTEGKVATTQAASPEQLVRGDGDGATRSQGSPEGRISNVQG